MNISCFSLPFTVIGAKGGLCPFGHGAKGFHPCGLRHEILRIGFAAIDRLAPLAVDERYRGQGIGRQLVYEGLDSLNEFGYAAVVTLGDPALYRRFGFEPAARFDLRCRWPDSAEAFQVHRLADDALEGVHGQVEYSDHFNRF